MIKGAVAILHFVLIFQKGMSFWKSSPGPTWSDLFWSSFSCSGVPIAQPIRRFRFAKPSSPSFILGLAHPSEATAISEFLASHFQITESSSCCLPADRIRYGIETDWIVVVAKQSKQIVGCVLCRFLGAVQFHILHQSQRKSSQFPKSGYIDFFCVAPEFRSTGLSSLLLKAVDYYSNEAGRAILFFQKEISPLLQLPPIWSGTYISREVLKTIPSLSVERTRKLPLFQQTAKFHISFVQKVQSHDTTYYLYDRGNFEIGVAITNTYHTYRGGSIGEVLFYRVQTEDSDVTSTQLASAIEEIIDSSEYRYILMDDSIPHLKQMPWKKDAPYYIYAYNVNPRKFFSVKPDFWF